jgi:hypothetical protein
MCSPYLVYASCLAIGVVDRTFTSSNQAVQMFPMTFVLNMTTPDIVVALVVTRNVT